MTEYSEIYRKIPDRLEILKERGVVSFDVGITPEEREAIEAVRIEKELSQFNYYGPAGEGLVEGLSAHLIQLEGNTEATIISLSRLVARVASLVEKDLRKEAVWAMVRVTLPSDDFDIPRWHQDGYYMRQDEGEEYKLVFTIKGPQSRFAEIVDEEGYRSCAKEDVTNVSEHEGNFDVYFQEDVRIKRALERTVMESDTIPEGRATFYRVGNGGAKVHSEPPLHEPRIFMSVVAGSLEQVEEFRKRYER